MADLGHSTATPTTTTTETESRNATTTTETESRNTTIESLNVTTVNVCPVFHYPNIELKQKS